MDVGVRFGPACIQTAECTALQEAKEQVPLLLSLTPGTSDVDLNGLMLINMIVPLTHHINRVGPTGQDRGN